MLIVQIRLIILTKNYSMD